jgi:alpha-L-arabinofuranosidase
VNCTGPLAAEHAITLTASLISLARLDPNTHVWPAVYTQHPKKATVPTICFDEWNIWDVTRAPCEDGAEEYYTLSDALALAVWLNVFVRQSKHLGMCNIAQSVNVISPLITTDTGIIKQTTYWPLLLFAKYMQGKTIAVHLSCKELKQERTNPEWIASTMRTPWLDVSAARGDDGYVNLAVVNISETEDMTTNVAAGISGKVEVFVVGGDEKGVTESNMTGGRVGIVESSWDGSGSFCFKKHSFTLLRWKV